MNIIKKILTRTNIGILLICLELLLIGGLFYRFINYLPAITVINYLLSILIILFLVKKDESPAYKISWIIIIMALPVAGGVLFLLFRHNRGLRKLRKRFVKENSIIVEYLKQQEKCENFDKRMASCFRYVQNESSYPVYQNTTTKYYPSGELMFEDMLAELSAAKNFIFMEYFIISEGVMWESILEILIKKAGEGVDVRLIYDDIGSLEQFNRSYLRRLKSAKIKPVAFNPFVPLTTFAMNHRDHRKITVIDGLTAFNGGVNIADEYINKKQRFGIWKDTGVQLKGDAVWSFTLMFIETWNISCKREERISDCEIFRNRHECISDGFIQPFGDSPLGKERLGENLFVEILHQAKNYVYIFTPYLIISEKMIYALQMTAKRGIDVRIATSGVPESKIIYRLTRSYYRVLLEAGVRIYEYTPGILHGKVFLCDDETAVVGTINLDYRSLYLNFECATVLHASKSIANIKDDMIKTLADGHEIMPADRKHTFWVELVDAVLRLYAPLM